MLNGKLAAILYTSVLLVFSCVCICPAGEWGALAYCSEKRMCSWAKEYSSAERAEQAALRQCEDYGGTRCKLVKTFRNTCAALALVDGEEGYGWATRSSLNSAKAAAKERCLQRGDRCSVKCAVCSRSSEPTTSDPEIPTTIYTDPPIIYVDPPDRNRFRYCNCCWKEMAGGRMRDPRTGRIILMDRIVTKCAWIPKFRCRTMGMGGGRCR